MIMIMMRMGDEEGVTDKMKKKEEDEEDLEMDNNDDTFANY